MEQRKPGKKINKENVSPNPPQNKPEHYKNIFKKIRTTHDTFIKVFLEASVSVGIATLDEGRFVAVSNAFLGLMGLTRDEVIGHTATEVGFVTPEDRILFFQEINEKGRIKNYEMKFRTKDGQLRQGLFNAAKITLDNKEYLLTIMSDITELKISQEALKISEQKYRRLFNDTPIGIYQVSPTGRFVMANKTVARILGYESPEDLINTVTDIATQVYVYPEDRAKALTLLKKDGYFENIELQNRQKDGNIIWVEASVHVVKDDKGNVLYHEGITKDITELKKTQELLRLSEIKYRQLYESMMDGYAQVDMEGRLIDCNDSLLQMTNYIREEILKLKYHDITPEKWHALEDYLVKRQLLTRGYTDVYEKEYIRKDGTVFPVDLRAVLLRDEEGNPVSVWAIIRDITERKRAAERLEKAEETYRLITENVADFIALVDKNGVFQHVSNAKDALGYETEELKNIKSVNALHPDDVVMFENIFREYARKRLREIAFESRIRHKDGHYMPMEIRVRPLISENGNFIGNVFAGCHISKNQKLNEHVLLSDIPHLKDSRITDREMEILKWIMVGKSTWDISQILNISESTVKFHVDNIMKKFNAVNRTHAVAIFLQSQQSGF